MDDLFCDHRPGLWDKVLYYAHVVIEPCRFTGNYSTFMGDLCLTADWIELGVPCPTCTKTLLDDYYRVHPDDD